MTKETKSDHTRKLINSPPGTPECHAAAIMKKLTESEGLPDGISTEAQLWDGIFKKEAYILQKQFFPLIQEIHCSAPLRQNTL